MGIFDIFKRPKTTKEPIDNDLPDEEYELPELNIGRFKMSEELRRRQENEELLKRYGIVLEKKGSFI